MRARGRLVALLAGAALTGAVSAGAQTAVTSTSGRPAAAATADGADATSRLVTGTSGAPSKLLLRPLLRATPRGASTARAVKTPSLVEATPVGTPVDLHVDDELEAAIRKGEDLILDRRYDEALDFFKALSSSHRDDALGPIGQMLVWQAQMLENNDFAHRKEYDAAAKEAQKRLDATPAASQGSWELMLEGGFYGVKAMHAMRDKSYLGAIDNGWTALSDMKSLRAKEPALADSGVGLGAYDYWRSVVTRNVKWLPFFSDKRKAGISEMETAFVSAQYTRPIAELLLVYVYIDEHRLEDAIHLAEDLGTKYPRNTLVRIQLGRAYSRQGRYLDAVAIYEKVLELQPDNRTAPYFLAANLVYANKDLDRAETILTKFVADPPADDWRGWGNERLGDLWMKRGDPKRAVSFWKKALQDNEDDAGVKHKIAHANDPKPAPRPRPSGSMPPPFMVPLPRGARAGDPRALTPGPAGSPTPATAR